MSKSWSATARRLSASLSAFNEFVVEALGVEGDDVIHASNGKGALARCKRQAADMLVTDIQLPGDRRVADRRTVS
jgi:CheY-like chemotaxis protein